MKDCFSYIRFSSVGQKDGSSVERQSPIAKRIADEKGWTLRVDLNAKDLAVSAYKGDNIKTLQTIMAAARNGKIPQGTVMIVEAFDRISRAELKIARRLFEDILEAGIEIYVDRGSRHFTKESQNDVLDLIIIVMELSQAHEYSDKLSARLKAAHASKRSKIQNGERVKIANLPSWVNSDFTPNEGKAQIVAGIFEKYLSGKGPGLIARELNQGKVSTLSGKGEWGQGVIYKLLGNRYVIGEYEVNGEAVKNYLPSVVSENDFLKVQSKMNDNRGKFSTGNKDGDNVYNIFAGVAECVCCGNKIAVKKQGQYMTCYGKLKGVCEQGMIRYGQFESSFASLLRYKADELVQDESGNTVNAHVQILNGQLAETEKQIANITQALTVAFTKSLVLKQSQLESEAEEIRKKIEVESAKKVTLNGASDRFHKILSRLDTLTTDNDLRIQVQGWIRENINRVTVDRKAKTYSVDFKNGQFITMNMDGSVIACKSFVELFGQNTVNLTETYQQQTFKAS